MIKIFPPGVPAAGLHRLPSSWCELKLPEVKAQRPTGCENVTEASSLHPGTRCSFCSFSSRWDSHRDAETLVFGLSSSTISWGTPHPLSKHRPISNNSHMDSLKIKRERRFFFFLKKGNFNIIKLKVKRIILADFFCKVILKLDWHVFHITVTLHSILLWPWWVF